MTKNKNFLTLSANGVQYGPFTTKQLNFLQKCQQINEIEGREFCCKDFPELSLENFRQYVHKLKNYIDVATKSFPTFYNIKGIHMIANNFQRVSGTILGNNMLALLNRLPQQQIIVKDLQMNSEIKPELFDQLYRSSVKTDESRPEILHWSLECESEILLTVRIIPTSIQILLQGKNQPIVYDMNGILKIAQLVGILEGFVRSIVFDETKTPFIGDWICILYTMGINGQYRYDKSEDHITWKDFAAGILRKYSEMGGKSDIDLLIDKRKM